MAHDTCAHALPKAETAIEQFRSLHALTVLPKVRI